MIENTVYARREVYGARTQKSLLMQFRLRGLGNCLFSPKLALALRITAVRRAACPHDMQVRAIFMAQVSPYRPRPRFQK